MQINSNFTLAKDQHRIFLYKLKMKIGKLRPVAGAQTHMRANLGEQWKL